MNKISIDIFVYHKLFRLPLESILSKIRRNYTPSVHPRVTLYLVFRRFDFDSDLFSREEFYHAIKLIERFPFFLILQVLVNFSEETESESDGQTYAQSGSNNVSNVYSNMDTIHMETFWSSILLIRCLSHLFTPILNLYLYLIRVFYASIIHHSLLSTHTDFSDSFNFSLLEAR